jgi:hypothetical protein
MKNRKILKIRAKPLGKRGQATFSGRRKTVSTMEGKKGDRLLFKYHRMKREPLLNTVGI